MHPDLFAPEEPSLPVPDPHQPGAPFGGFGPAATAAVSYLNQKVPGMDLWLVTCVQEDRQLVIARAGAWADLAPPGAAFSWQASFCVQMASGAAPSLAPRFTHIPVYEKAAIGPLARVRAYLGVPLRLERGELFGTLCAFAGVPRPDSLAEAMPTVTLIGRMLGTILDGERTTHDRSAEAAQAYALAERDPLTGLRNRRGFEALLHMEQARCRRFGSRCSVLALTVEDRPAADSYGVEADPAEQAAGDAQLRSCAKLLAHASQPCDVTGRVDGREFAILAVETDVVGARARAARLRKALRTAQVPALLGVATRRVGEDLAQTWERAQQAQRLERAGARPADPPEQSADPPNPQHRPRPVAVPAARARSKTDPHPHPHPRPRVRRPRGPGAASTGRRPSPGEPGRRPSPGEPASGHDRRDLHNSQIHAAAAAGHRCGMTHLASGRVCLLPERHPGACAFRDPADLGAALTP
ncbi:MAG TPA: diguanylate cyclase [Mycobacteriales bacterium]|nr:diguanylate cyclase [Mycobacteriales bacterium]